MAQLKILVLLEHLTCERKAMLEAVAPEAEYIYADRDSVDKQAVQGAHIILGNPSSDKVKDSPNLKYLQLASAGAENYLKPGVLQDDVLVCSGTGTYGIPISEYMVGAVFAMFKNLMLYRDQQKRETWKRIREYTNKPVFGSTVLVVGAGDIGGNFLMRMKAMGCHTIGIRRTDGEKPEYVDEQYTAEQMDDVLPRADVVALALPHTPQTAGLFDARRLSLLKEDAVLINVGRGTAIDTNALCDELSKGRIRGAVLDVTDPEPLPKDHRLWKFDNVFITPHSCAANSALAQQKSFEVCYENFKAYVQGREPMSRIDKSTGYRVSRK